MPYYSNAEYCELTDPAIAEIAVGAKVQEQAENEPSDFDTAVALLCVKGVQTAGVTFQLNECHIVNTGKMERWFYLKKQGLEARLYENKEIGEITTAKGSSKKKTYATYREIVLDVIEELKTKS